MYSYHELLPRFRVCVSAFVWTSVCQRVWSVSFCRTSLQVTVSMLSNWFTISCQSPIWSGDNGREEHLRICHTLTFEERWQSAPSPSVLNVTSRLGDECWPQFNVHNRHRMHTWQQFIHVPAENKSERAAEGRGVNMIVSQICNPYFEI